MRPVLVQSGILALLLLAVDPGGPMLAWIATQDLTPFITAAAPGVPTLLGALIGGTITGAVTYIIARQNRLGQLVLLR